MENDSKHLTQSCSSKTSHDENHKDKTDPLFKDSKAIDNNVSSDISPIPLGDVSSNPSANSPHSLPMNTSASSSVIPSSSVTSCENPTLSIDEPLPNLDVDEDGEEVLTLDQLLAKDDEDEGLIETANCVLGAADDEKCSYSQVRLLNL